MQQTKTLSIPHFSQNGSTEKMSPLDSRSLVVSVDPERMGGTPCFINTRIPIKHLWDYLEGGGTIAEFMDDFEGVSFEQCLLVLKMAREKFMEGLPQP